MEKKNDNKNRPHGLYIRVSIIIIESILTVKNNWIKNSNYSSDVSLIFYIHEAKHFGIKSNSFI